MTEAAPHGGSTWEGLADELLDVAREAQAVGDMIVSLAAALQAMQCLTIARNLKVSREHLDLARVH